MNTYDHTGTYPELDDLSYQKILQLNTTHLRNLAWYLFSRPLSFSGIDLELKKADVDWAFRDWEWFEQQDQQPSKISQYLKDKRKNNRLGFYAETLLNYWFENNDHFDLLEVGTQIEKEGKTITEIDFFFRDTITNEYYFWETTLKFYLFDPKSKEWIGPGSRDKARLKLKKVGQLQLPEGERYLKDHYDFDFHTQLFVKGRLFHPDHPTLQWLHYSAFCEIYNSSNAHFYLIPKSDWLFADTIHTSRGSSFQQIMPQIQKAIKEKEKALLFIQDERSTRFVFLVKDGWPDLH